MHFVLVVIASNLFAGERLMVALDEKAKKAGVQLAYIGFGMKEDLFWQDVKSMEDVNGLEDFQAELTSLTSTWNVTRQHVLDETVLVIVQGRQNESPSFWAKQTKLRIERFKGTFDQLFDQIETLHQWYINWPHGLSLPIYFSGGHLTATFEISQFEGNVVDLILRVLVSIKKSKSKGLLAGMLARGGKLPDGQDWSELLIFANSRLYPFAEFASKELVFPRIRKNKAWDGFFKE
jgi:hypothetical protein